MICLLTEAEGVLGRVDVAVVHDRDVTAYGQ
jgi:hypothetical protein